MAGLVYCPLATNTVSVYPAPMDAYRRALAAYLEPEDRTQDALASRINRTQAAVSRYVTGERFPDAATARLIHDATAGSVPFETWQQVAAAKYLGEAA